MANPQGRTRAPGSLPDCLPADIGRFSQAQRAIWEERVGSPWVLDTVLRGYKLQFRCRPPPFRGIRVTTVSDPSKRVVLRLEITSLIAKGAIRKLEPSEQLNGFYSRYFIVPKKGGGYRPILDLRMLNRCLKNLKFKMPSPARVLQLPAPSPKVPAHSLSGLTCWSAIVYLTLGCFGPEWYYPIRIGGGGGPNDKANQRR